MLIYKPYISLLIVITLVLSGCLPVIFTGATKSAMEFAKDRPASDTFSDIKIATLIKAELAKRNFRELFTKVKLEVVNGRVLYTGIVSKEEDALKAIEIAWQQPGVTEVIDEIKIDQNSGHFDLVQYTRDTMITSQIKSKVFIHRDIKFVNYTVITINDIVYLFGIARSQEELEKVANIASNIHGVKKVVTHINIQPFTGRARSGKPAVDTTKEDNLIIEDSNDSAAGSNLDR